MTRPARARTLRFSLLVTVVLLLAGAVAGGTAPLSHLPVPAAPRADGTAGPVSPPTVAVHYGHPRVPGDTAGPARATSAVTVPWNCTPVGNVSFPAVGVNFTFSSTPANGSGAAPLNFSWNISIGSGGLPPFHPWLTFSTGSQSLTSFRPSGNMVLGQAGLWSVQVLVEDATCTQEGATNFELMAWNSTLGPHPVHVNVTPRTGGAPLNVTYTFVQPTIPTGWSLYWLGLGFYPYTAIENHTYYLPGTYNETVCLVEPDGTDYACGTSENVNVSGPSPLKTGISVSTGPFPVNVTFWANITNVSAFPNGTSIYLYAWNGTSGLDVSTDNTTAQLIVSVGCGYPWTRWAIPTGTCLETGSVVLTGPPGSPDDGDLAQVPLSTTLAASGSPVNWWPSVTYTYGPSNGSAPLNVSINISATHGLSPYTLQWAAAGDSGNGTNATFYNTTGSILSGWNGTPLTIGVPLALQGYYWIVVSVVATNWGYVNFALPLIIVGNATVPVFQPLIVHAAVTGANGSSPGNATVGQSFQFVADPVGGAGPYSIQWNFGDGQFASSVPGVAVNHTYSTAGQFAPMVMVTDARGVEVTTSLPTVTVTPTSHGPGSGARNGTGSGGVPTQIVGPSSSSAPSWTFAMFGAIGATAFILAALFLFRREVGREGEALVAGLDPAEPATPRDLRR